jgi:hypothetical protein
MSTHNHPCRRLDKPPLLTGDPRRAPWTEMAPVGDLVLSSGKGTPSQATQVWAAWDADHLYVAFWCADTDIRATFTQRDDKVWQEEAAEFFVSVDDDLTDYFEFQFSPRNVVRDIHVTNPNGRMEGSTFDGAWDCAGLRHETHVVGTINDASRPDEGWGLEVAVPFDGLLGPGVRPAPGDAWRVNFFRIYRQPIEEFCSWSPTGIDPWEFHVPAKFGTLIFQA